MNNDNDWEDDWENIEIPDLGQLIKNKERELKLLEERKAMEEADLVLTEELFGKQNMEQKSVPKVEQKSIPKVEQKSIPKVEQKTVSKKEQKRQKKRQEELFGKATLVDLDEYEEQYGHLEEQY